MAQQYASGETMRLTLKLTPAATSMTGNKDVGTTSGRFFLSNNNQVEWISFTGITNNGDGTYTYTGLTRGLSQTADPVTAGTGSTWLQNQECILVAMHDQLVDKTQATTFASTITFADDINFSGTTKAGLTLKSLTTAERNALTPNVGDKIINTTTGTEQTYYAGTWNDAGTSTTPNASTTVAGKVEMATQAEVNAGTSTGGTGAPLAVGPAESKVVTDALATSIATVSSSIGSTILTLGETISSGAVVSLFPNGNIYNNLVTGSEGIQIAAAPINFPTTVAQTVSLNSSTIITIRGSYNGAGGYLDVAAGTVSNNSVSMGSTSNLVTTSGSDIFNFGIAAINSTTFVVTYVYHTSSSGAGAGWYVKMIAGTVSGNTITFGTVVNHIFNGSSALSGGTCTKVSSSKFASTFTYGGANKMILGTVSGTTITLGTEASGFAFLPTAGAYVADDIYVLTEGVNIRRYTSSGTTPTEGNNLAIGTTYTNPSIKNIDAQKCIFSGTNGGSTFAFIVDVTGVTPTKGTTVTVAATASTDCTKTSSSSVAICTNANVIYNYNYSGSTLSLENIVTSPNTTIGNFNSFNYVKDFVTCNCRLDTSTSAYVLYGHIWSNTPHYSVGIIQSSGVISDTRVVKYIGGISTVHSSLSVGSAYYAVSNGSLSTGSTTTGTFYVGKALSATSILVGIPYSTL